MKEQEFKKLRIYLPRQPIVNQRPWWIAGLLLAFIVLLLAAYCYLAYKKNTAFSEKPNQAKVENKK